MEEENKNNEGEEEEVKPKEVKTRGDPVVRVM